MLLSGTAGSRGLSKVIKILFLSWAVSPWGGKDCHWLSRLTFFTQLEILVQRESPTSENALEGLHCMLIPNHVATLKRMPVQVVGSALYKPHGWRRGWGICPLLGVHLSSVKHMFNKLPTPNSFEVCQRDVAAGRVVLLLDSWDVNTVTPGQPRSEIGGTYRIYELCGYPWVVSGWGREPTEKIRLLGKGRTAAWSIWEIAIDVTSFVPTDWRRPRHPGYIAMCTVLLRNQTVCVWAKETKYIYIDNLCPLKEFPVFSLQLWFLFIQRCFHYL